jgi:ferritin
MLYSGSDWEHVYAKGEVKMDKMDKLISLLGEENIEELKKQITRVIIERVESDMDDYDRYLLYPPDMRETIKETMESVDKKVAKMYKDAIIEINEDYIEKMKNYMTHQVNESALRSKVFDYATKLKFYGNEFSKEYKISQELFKILKETEPDDRKE